MMSISLSQFSLLLCSVFLVVVLACSAFHRSTYGLRITTSYLGCRWNIVGKPCDIIFAGEVTVALRIRAHKLLFEFAVVFTVCPGKIFFGTVFTA